MHCFNGRFLSERLGNHAEALTGLQAAVSFQEGFVGAFHACLHVFLPSYLVCLERRMVFRSWEDACTWTSSATGLGNHESCSQWKLTEIGPDFES